MSDQPLPSAEIAEQMTDLSQAEVLHVENSAVARAQADRIVMEQSAIGAGQFHTIEATESAIGAAVATDITIHDGALVAGAAETIDLRNCRAGAVVAQNITVGNQLNTRVLIAGSVDGPVNTQIDTAGVVTIGLVAGAVIGLLLLLFGRAGQH